MLTKQDLLTQNKIPEISDITLKLYVEFFEENLHGKIYEYKLNNGWNIKLKLDKSRVHHLLGIQHIDNTIDKNTFIDDIKDGKVTISMLKDNNGKKRRFNDMKDRILMFSCIYYLLEHCFCFYVPTGIVPNSRVPADFLLFNLVSEKGLQLAVKKNKDNEYYKTMSLMPSRAANNDKYIKGLDEFIVIQINIFDKDNKLVKEIINNKLQHRESAVDEIKPKGLEGQASKVIYDGIINKEIVDEFEKEIIKST